MKRRGRRRRKRRKDDGEGNEMWNMKKTLTPGEKKTFEEREEGGKEGGY